GLGADRELARDGLVGEATDDELEDFALPRRQKVQWLRFAVAIDGGRRHREQGLDAWREGTLAGRDAPQRVDELRGGLVLACIAADAGGKGFADPIRVRICR